MKQLVVNADDFGFTRDVNLGIIECHRNGILTATTLMANGKEFDHAVELSRAHPALDIGCHLVLIGGSSLLPAYAPFPKSVAEMLGAVSRRRLDAKAEFRAQIEKILQAGIKPTHLDTHKHTHLFPPVLDAVAALSREYGIHWVRRPFDFPLSGAEKAIVPGLKQATSRGLQFLRRHVHARLARDGCRTTDHFAGFQITGRFQSGQLTSLIRNLPEGSTEFMCHPGFCTDELRQAQTRLKESREMELRAITDPEVRNVLSEQNVHLVNYRGL